MAFDTKIKIVLREDLEVWQKLNVTAFLMSGIAGIQNIIGEYYIDKYNVQYLTMNKQPVMIHSSKKDSMVELLQKTLNKVVVISVYTEELFSTNNDADNREVIAKYKTEDLILVGIGIRGKKNHVDKL